MTSSSENENHITVIQELEKNQNEEISTINEQDERNNSLHEIEEKPNLNDDTIINSDTTTVNINEEQKEITVNNIEDDNRSKKSFNSKVKYSSIPYHRSPYYTNSHPYGPAPYYYYQVASIHEKPTPLMVIPTQPPSTTTTTTITDNQTGNSTAVSPQNLPPRLRQTSTNENDTNVQSSTSQPPPQPTTTTTNGRRHRSILPRGSSHYYSQHPPPPLMATPPGVLYPYQPGHIAYNIRTPDELELLAFQQQYLSLQPPPPSLIWPPPPPPATYPQYPSYPMYGPLPYMYNNTSTMDSNNSSLNPEAAEWIPIQTDNDLSSSDNNILIDDEINFPPLNNNRIEENNSEQKSSNDSSPPNEPTTTITTTTTNNNNDKSTSPSPTKIDLNNQDDNKHLSSSSKLTTITYSTVILQTPDRNKSNKNTTTTTNNNNNQHQRSSNHAHVQLPSKQRTQIRVSKEITSRRRQIPSNRNNNFNNTRNILPIEVPKLVQSTDDWIEVKSKKTKKFDRSINEQNSSQKFVSDESMKKILSPSSTGENTTTTCTSEEEEIHDNKLLMILENKTITTTTDYNQIIIDDIHQRLDNNERLLIIIRGCPGSGKSTLAKSLNNGYNGQILSIDEYFKDMNSNEYLFDPPKLEDAHIYNRRLASDAFKRNISPIIIDNTNTTSWEMKPYVVMGKEAGYDILLIEPQTPWRYKPRELVKRNLHNLPLRRIKEILNRFEHNVTVQSIIDQLKTNLFLPCQTQLLNSETDTESSIDPILISKKSFDIIDDSTILDDVRLCINDMILFLTSNFYQTSLSIPLSDLSLISSSSSTPTTPHSLFHRSLSRFQSSTTTTNQDHSFSNEHTLRSPTTTTFSRCFENLTSSSSLTNSSIIGKKRKKNKNKQQTNEILLNTNNNNNNYNHYSYDQENNLTYHVYLQEDTSDFIVIDDHQTFENLASPQKISSCNYSSPINSQQKSTINNNNELLNIIHDQLTTRSTTIDSQRSLISMNHIGIQCSSNDFLNDINQSDRILIGHSSSSIISSIPFKTPPLPTGYNERGIQVDLNDNQFDSLASLIEFYSEFLPIETIKQFYELYNSDIHWTRIQLDEYLQHTDIISTIPTLRQLSLNALNQWNEQIKSSNPSFDTISSGDLLQDINDEDIFEELILDNNNNTNQNTMEYSDPKQITIPWLMINSLQELYGELPIASTFSYTNDGLTLPLDDQLSMNIYQGLQRFLGISNKVNKPVNEKKLIKENRKLNKQQQQQQQRISPIQNDSNKKLNGPSLKQIMNEELKSMNTQKQTQKRQLDFASQHKLKELERHFPSLSSDILYDIFIENESDYDLTFVCISSMLDENASIATIPKSQSIPPSSSSSNIRSTNSYNKSEQDSYETSRQHARNYALKRKEYFNKADQANRHGMTGVASYYINQAREQTRLMKEANRQACEYLSKTRLNKFRQTNQLDLHELHADEALHLFKEIEQELNEGARRTTLKSIEIITGYGKNSPYGGGCGKIHSVILAYLRQRNYKYSEQNKGAILVQL